MKGPDDDICMLLMYAGKCMLAVCLDYMPDDHEAKGAYPWMLAGCNRSRIRQMVQLADTVYTALLMLSGDNGIC